MKRVFIFTTLVLAVVLIRLRLGRVAEINQGSISDLAPAQIAPALPPASRSIAVTAVKTLNSEDVRKVEILDSILQSKNDNDPRLDTEFLNLSAGAKNLMRDKYTAFAAEKLNERGTIVYLLGRNLTSSEDFAFLQKVLDEPPCRNLANCQGDTDLNDHASLEAGAEVTLAYPQMMALNSLERTLNVSKDDLLRSMAVNDLRFAKNSSVAIVSRKATELLNRYDHP